MSALPRLYSCHDNGIVYRQNGRDLGLDFEAGKGNLVTNGDRNNKKRPKKVMPSGKISHWPLMKLDGNGRYFFK